MAQFLGDIAGMLELFAVAGGLVVLHQAAKDAPAKLLKAAGALLVVGGIAGGICTSWYWLKYQRAGDFDTAAGWHSGTAPGVMPGPRGMRRMHRGPAPSGER